MAATPRHRFVHRFRLAGGGPVRGSFHLGDGGPMRGDSTDPAQNLSDIYNDAVMDAAGEPLPSFNSQPSYVLHLLHLLELERGQAVLEIGSGSGWLAVVTAQLVGTEGRVVGIKLLPDLAVQSGIDLALLGMGNVQVIIDVGTRGHAAGAPYERVTAAAWAGRSRASWPVSAAETGGRGCPCRRSG